jgi:predicted acetyltransferase
MYVLIFKSIVLSILFIFLVHNIIYFFKDNLTIPKTKDLVSITEKKYDEIYNLIKHSSMYNNISTIPNITSAIDSTTSIDELPTQIDMKNELRNFLKSHH